MNESFLGVVFFYHAMIVPEKQINVIYTLNTVFHVLGSTIGMSWLYMVLVWACLCNLLANVITNMAGPSFMLGQAGGSVFYLTGSNKKISIVCQLT